MIPFIFALLIITNVSAFPMSLPTIRSTLIPRQGGSALGNLTNAQAEAAYAAMCSAATSPAGMGNATADITAVSDNALALQNNFASIASLISQIDNGGLLGMKFLPQWQALNQNWTNILWTSRNTASQTTAYCESFVDVIMPFIVGVDGPVPNSEAVTVLQQYIAETSSLEVAANQTQRSFEELASDLTTFANAFQQYVESEDSTIAQQLSWIQGNISALETKIHDYNIAIDVDLAALSATVFDSTVLGLVPGFGDVVAVAAFVGLGVEVGTYVALRLERDHAQAQVDNEQFQYYETEAELAEVGYVNASVAAIATNTSMMTTQLGAFDAIWGAVVTDSNKVIDYLTNATQDLNTPIAYWAAINGAECYYQTLITALDDYADGIGSSGIPPPSSSAKTQSLAKSDFKTRASEIVAEASARIKA